MYIFSFPDVMMPAYKVSRWWATFYIIYVSLELFLFMNLVSTSLYLPTDQFQFHGFSNQSLV